MNLCALFAPQSKTSTLEKINDQTPGHLTEHAMHPIPALAAGVGMIPGRVAVHSSPRGTGGAGLLERFRQR